jgi:hypothetical protein
VKILFDQGTPNPLRSHLAGHEVHTAYELGWSTLNNGKLLEAAEAQGFELSLTTDMNLRYQQNLSNRQIAVVVLQSTSWPKIKMRIAAVRDSISAATAGSYSEVTI